MITNDNVENIADKLGFDLVGFSRLTTLDVEIDALKKWLGKGYNSNMQYMERNIEKREDVKQILPEAKSVISLGLNYFVQGKESGNSSYGKVSRYAWGKDYHYIIWEKLETLINKIKQIDKSFEAIGYVDTGPVMDKAWAVKSGIGWRGKNSNVINPEIGSWFFIASLITNYEFEQTEVITDHCGKCTTCIDACPTDAIVEPYVVDANRCISYLTIENKGEIPDKFSGKFDGWIFGCDICQEVCPWNIKFAKPTKVKEFDGENREIEIKSVSNLTNSRFKKKYISSPIYRAKAKGLKRNAEFLMNSGTENNLE